MSEVKTCKRCGSTERTAQGKECRPCTQARQRVWKRKARARVDPKEHDYSKPLPPGFRLRGISDLLDAQGNVQMRWVKSVEEPSDHLERLFTAVEGLKDKIPLADPIPAPPAHAPEDLLLVYPMGDPHFGMYSWAEETGTDFDLDIAERLLLRAVDHLVALAPPAHTAIILNLGDFFHADNSSSRTMRSSAPLDTDTRWAKVLAIGIRTMCRAIDRALQKHTHVIVRNEIGNHDDHTSIALALALAHHYHQEPRVEIDTSPAKFWYYEFGSCLIGSTHTDTVKPVQLPAIMSVDRAEAWGRTVHRQWYTGHIHHVRVEEGLGAMVESFRTLAGRDAWHAAKGYRSGRDMRADIWHHKLGLINRHIVGVDAL